ncbi:MAG: hypothetical protein KJ914_02985 [Gammaproteobacteria bacterium]|nr:hypothetical protein [Gammaproteobacteria bacterium]MBU1725650.1 hypothetical protein [Gammaproteobacteria bacterium]MBU2003998.1 hypothetical protein [Gammaproteobacteria bacterium]
MRTKPALFPRVAVTAAILAALGLWNTPLWADDDVDEAGETPQPLNDFFQSDSVFPQEQGEWQVSIGADYIKSDAGKVTTLTTGLEYGITDSLQVELEHTPYIKIKPGDADEATLDGQGNTELGLKKSWMHIGGSPNSVAVGYEHEFANGDDDVIADEDEEASDSDTVHITLARDLDTTGNTQASLQVGREMADAGDENFANLAAFHAVGRHVFTGEYNWSDEESWVTPGVYWKPAKGLDVGAAVAFGVGDTDGNRALLLRLNYEWD